LSQAHSFPRRLASADISTIKRAVREAARYYAKICKLGHDLGYLDVGGGLGVDYGRFTQRLRQLGQLFAPGIANDGRLEHHGRLRFRRCRASVDRERKAGAPLSRINSVLVVEAFSSIEKTAPKVKVTPGEKDHKLVNDILRRETAPQTRNRIESLHDIQQIKEESQETFNLGLLRSRIEAKIDTVYWQLAQQI